MFYRIPIATLSDLQWHALLPYVERRSPQGRPLKELRKRMDAIFRLVATDAPWREIPPEFGKGATVARHFRRLTHAGLWEKLLETLAEVSPAHPLNDLRAVIFRAARRAYRIRGLGLIVLARRLGFVRALNGPCWLIADPDLSETLRALPPPEESWGKRAVRRWHAALRGLLRRTAGRRSIPRSVRLAFP